MNNIRKLRTLRNITQQDLANEIHVERTSVGKYEKYDVLPNKEVLFRLADFFQVSLDYLLGYSSNTEETKLTLEQKQLLKLFENATPQGQKVASSVLELAQIPGGNTKQEMPPAQHGPTATPKKHRQSPNY